MSIQMDKIYLLNKEPVVKITDQFEQWWIWIIICVSSEVIRNPGTIGLIKIMM